MNTTATPTTDDSPAPIQARACDACGQTDAYQPEMLFGKDIFEHVPFFCQECTALREKQAEAEQQQAAIAAMKDTWEKLVPERYRGTDIAHPDFNKSAWIAIRGGDWRQHGIGLIGGPGRCKSRILALLAKRDIYAGRRIEWVNPFDIDDIRRGREDRVTASEARRRFKAITQAQVLYIDDLGKTPFSPGFSAILFDVIEGRYNSNLVTHWSLNPIPEDMKAMAEGNVIPPEVVANALDPDGIARNRHLLAPIVSRLRETTKFVLLK